MCCSGTRPRGRRAARCWDTVASVLSPEQQKKVQALAKDPAVMAEVQRDVDAGTKEKHHQHPDDLRDARDAAFPDLYPVNYGFLRSLLNGYLK